MAGLISCMPKPAEKPKKKKASRGVVPVPTAELMASLASVERAVADLKIYLKSFQTDGVENIPCEALGLKAAVKGVTRVHASIARNQT